MSFSDVSRFTTLPPNKPPRTFLNVDIDTLETQFVIDLEWSATDEDGSIGHYVWGWTRPGASDFSDFYIGWRQEPTLATHATFRIDVETLPWLWLFTVYAVDDDGAWDPSPREFRLQFREPRTLGAPDRPG